MRTNNTVSIAPGLVKQSNTPSTQAPESAWSIFHIFLRLGLTSFGGPVAHLGYFRDEFITRRRWLSEQQYADLLALCHFLPGPSSSQVGMGLGISQAGYGGAFAAWLGFTMPSALLLILFAFGVSIYQEMIPDTALHGLAIVAVAVIAQAVWGMTRSLCPDTPRITMMVTVTCYLLLFPSIWGQIVTMLAAGIIGLLLFKPDIVEHDQQLAVPITQRQGVVWLSLFAILLLALPLAVNLVPTLPLQLVDSFYRAGSLVFGGGHVVLPLLQEEISAYPEAKIITLGEPVFQALVSSGFKKVNKYWAYCGNTTAIVNNFSYCKAEDNKLHRTIFPFPHQPTKKRNKFYGQYFSVYAQYVCKQ